VAERRLDALTTPVVTNSGDESFGENKKSDLFAGRFFAKRRRRKESLSGKAMHDAASARAKTHGLKMFQFLEEG
jgi:hypothetical protein